MKTLTLDNMQVAMQLWDTAGQERCVETLKRSHLCQRRCVTVGAEASRHCRRYRSITKQFFRKADGVVVMYDVTVEESFRAVKPWFANVQV